MTVEGKDNGFLECFRRIVVREYLNPLRRDYVEPLMKEGGFISLKAVSLDFQNWLARFNTERPHGWFPNFGMTPLTRVNSLHEIDVTLTPFPYVSESVH
jgi:hypothetical protein